MQSEFQFYNWMECDEIKQLGNVKFHKDLLSISIELLLFSVKMY